MDNAQTFKQGCGAPCSYILEPGIKLQLRFGVGGREASNKQTIEIEMCQNSGLFSKSWSLQIKLLAQAQPGFKTAYLLGFFLFLFQIEITTKLALCLNFTA